MSNSSSKGTALITGASRGIGAVYADRLAHGLPLSVRGGGHDWAGRALSHQGLVVDLSRMRQVEVDVRGRLATVAGGALAGDVVAAAGPRALASV